ncbi:hypothetical protein HUT18_09895 [Streptomyces sp. NA04227]|uniref:hypothetical protein n=1 Tax=Streptomyces sp. NA04227 TaxID=2742136 RepID=UPI001591D548|nr:hypothetical protein [Streptomyces sp. NA04227]QKW04960.1 hypothetical protein HUT18_09895 [Streptomyces sp. NA04227]
MPNDEGEGGWRPPGWNGPNWEPPKHDPPQRPPHNGGEGPDGRSHWSVPGVVAVIVAVVWSVLAYQWTEQNDCGLVESYGLVISHGTPDFWERCGD